MTSIDSQVLLTSSLCVIEWNQIFFEMGFKTMIWYISSLTKEILNFESMNSTKIENVQIIVTEKVH